MTPVFAEVPLGKLHFDPDNPRFPPSLDGSEQREVLEFMLDDAGLTDLMDSIASQGFFPGEPILVCPGPGDSWTVVEGNRRFAATLLLHNPELAPTRRKQVTAIAKSCTPPESVPCLQFGERAEILQHLGYRHVTGIKEWEPLAKARFLLQRYEVTAGTREVRLREIARSIGSRSDYVGRLLASLALYHEIEEKKFFGVPGLDEDSLQFSLISSALAYSNIVQFLGLEDSQDFELSALVSRHLKELVGWVFAKVEGKSAIRESRNIGLLASVVADERALAAFREGATIEAAARIATGAEEFRSYLTSAKDNLVSAKQEIRDVTVTPLDASLIEDVRKLAVSIKRQIERSLEEDE